MPIERTASPLHVPARPPEGHKGTFGRVLVVAGSRGMSGAAVLAGLGALRGGAGLVFVATPGSVQPIVAGCEPSYLTIGLPEDGEGRIAAGARDVLGPRLGEFEAIALGPGWGRSAELDALARWLWDAAPVPLVADADALNALAATGGPSSSNGTTGSQDAPSDRADRPARIVTPHPGEFARLTGRSTAEIAAQREELAARAAAEWGAVVVLKGAGTVVADGRRVAVNATGNSGMGTGGTGDVLTGLTTALLAQRLPAFEAARLAVHLHGLAGDLAAQEQSEPGLIASDLPRHLGAAWRHVLGSARA